MRHTKRHVRKNRRKSRRGGGLFGPSASDKYVDELLANLNNGKIEDILKRLYYNLERSLIPKLKEKAQGQNIDYLIQRINAIVTEREANEIQ